MFLTNVCRGYIKLKLCKSEVWRNFTSLKLHAHMDKKKALRVLQAPTIL